ncbi:transmembrane O-methyltransferase homolog [Cetorhinus maximus]
MRLPFIHKINPISACSCRRRDLSGQTPRGPLLQKGGARGRFWMRCRTRPTIYRRFTVKSLRVKNGHSGKLTKALQGIRKDKGSLVQNMKVWLPVLAVVLLPVCSALVSHYHRWLIHFYRHRFLSWLRTCLTGISGEERAFRYVLMNSTHGKPESVLSTLDEWCCKYECVTDTGPEKGQILDSVVRRVVPVSVLQLGMGCGYSAIRIARLLTPRAKLYTLEQDPRIAEVAEEMMLVAGLKHTQFQVIAGPPTETIPRFKPSLGVERFDFVFLSQGQGENHLRDLCLLEKEGLLSEGSVILANSVTHAGAAGFLSSVRRDPRYHTSFHPCSAPYGKDITDGMEELVFQKEGGGGN